MNGKQSKRLRKLSAECSIGYRPLKHAYKQICTMDGMQEKTLFKQDSSKGEGQVPAQVEANKEIQ